MEHCADGPTKRSERHQWTFRVGASDTAVAVVGAVRRTHEISEGVTDSETQETNSEEVITHGHAKVGLRNHAD
jgi:hypothetical protein